MRMSTPTKNILTAAIAALFFAAFVGLATRGGNSDAQKRLNALENTTSTSVFVEPTSTTVFTLPSTTTVPLTTVPPAVTPTTVKAKTTTATTRKPSTTKTTRAPAPACTQVAAPSGSQLETSDNQYSFTLPSGPSSGKPSPSSDRFSFTVEATPTAANTVHFSIELRNQTAKTISFPGGVVQITVTVSQPGSANQTYELNSAFAPMQPCERALVSTTTDPNVNGSGSFTASAATTVDYGS
jgi:hypothetical protein